MGKDNKSKYQEYSNLVDKLTPDSQMLGPCLRAFWVGGLI